MKLTTARKISAHAAVLFAFGALALGGAMPPLAIAVFVVLLPLAFKFEGRLKSDTVWPSLLLLALLVTLTLLFLWDVLELAVAASLFAMALVLQRLFTRKRAADDGLLYLTALLMLTGGAALTAELLYGVCFVGFALSATSALTLSQLSRQAEEVDAPASLVNRLLSQRLMGSLIGLSGAALLIGLALFFIFPRMTAGAFARKTPIGGRSGFSDKIRLDTAGMLKADPRPALRVKFASDPGIESLELHWRGTAFDFYDGIEWQRMSKDTAEPLPVPRLRVGSERTVNDRLSITVFPTASEATVFVPEGAVRLEALRAFQTGARREMPPFFFSDARGQVRLSRPAANGFQYEVALGSALSVREKFDDSLTPFTLQAIQGSDVLERLAQSPDSIESSNGTFSEAHHLLRLPEALDPRIPALAQRLTEGKTGLAQKVRSIEAHLSAFVYSMELDHGGSDPLAYFLFESHSGHCELFATALAVMLRTVDIPARVVGGFYGGEKTEEGDFVVRLANAHAWVEVFIDGIGFVTVDPTPPEGRLPQTSGFLTWLTDHYDRLSARWQNIVIDLTLWDQWRALRSTSQKLVNAFQRLQSGQPSNKISFKQLSKPLAIFFLSLMALLALHRFMRRGGGARRPSEWHGDLLALALYRRLNAKLRRHGFERRSGETAYEFLERLEREGAPAMPIVRVVMKRYLLSRFGAQPLSRGEARHLMGLLRSF